MAASPLQELKKSLQRAGIERVKRSIVRKQAPTRDPYISDWRERFHNAAFEIAYLRAQICNLRKRATALILVSGFLLGYSLCNLFIWKPSNHFSVNGIVVNAKYVVASGVFFPAEGKLPPPGTRVRIEGHGLKAEKITWRKP